jgi:predicted DNA-binding transcriptional regulator YafY
VRLAVDADARERVVGRLSSDVTVTDAADGSAIVDIPVTNRAAFRSLVLGFGEHVEVAEPPEVRAEIVGWLEQCAAGAPPR